MYIPLGDFEDGRVLKRNVVRTSASVEKGLVYLQEEKLSEAELQTWIVSSSVAYGLSDQLTIGYTTWNTSIPFISSRFFLKMTLYSSDHVSIALMPAGIYAKTGEIVDGHELKSQRYYGTSVSIPMSYHNGFTGMYIAPRFWFGKYEQHTAMYQTVHTPSYQRIRTGDAVITNGRNYRSIAAGFSFSFQRFSIIPEGIIHQIDGRRFVTTGIRFGMIY